jgi:hypothetical protein
MVERRNVDTTVNRLTVQRRLAVVQHSLGIERLSPGRLNR